MLRLLQQSERAQSQQQPPLSKQALDSTGHCTTESRYRRVPPIACHCLLYATGWPPLCRRTPPTGRIAPRRGRRPFKEATSARIFMEETTLYILANVSQQYQTGAISPKFWPQFGNFSQFLVASRTMFASIIICTQ